MFNDLDVVVRFRATWIFREKASYAFSFDTTLDANDIYRMISWSLSHRGTGWSCSSDLRLRPLRFGDPSSSLSSARDGLTDAPKHSLDMQCEMKYSGALRLSNCSNSFQSFNVRDVLRMNNASSSSKLDVLEVPCVEESLVMLLEEAFAFGLGRGRGRGLASDMLQFKRGAWEFQGFARGLCHAL